VQAVLRKLSDVQREQPHPSQLVLCARRSAPGGRRRQRSCSRRQAASVLAAAARQLQTSAESQNPTASACVKESQRRLPSCDSAKVADSSALRGAC
jgi:hypothetical protein